MSSNKRKDPVYPDDHNFKEHTITKADPDGSFTMDDGWSFFCPRDSAVRPRVGATVRLYGRGTGYSVRGLYIDGARAFYRTEAEHEALRVAENEKRESERKRAWEATGRAEYEATKATLPDVFQRRLSRFESNLADFGPQHGAYELSCCVDGALIAATLKTPDAVRAFGKASWAEQQALVPGLFDGHSGNTFGMACRLAHHYLTDPSLVWREHAAISALLGCDAAGCPPVKYTTPPAPGERR